MVRRAAEQDRRDVARRRQQWLAYQDKVDPKRLVFIDETWTRTNMAPKRGWGRRGTRLVGTAPFKKWETLTFVAALRCDRLDAPCVFDGAMNGDRFRAYVEHLLVPTLRDGDIVIMDNLGSHKSQPVRRMIRAAGAKLFFLPKYSPDLQPIEQVFAKLKHSLRKAQARTVDTLWQAIGARLNDFTPEECANYLKNSGYAAT